MQNTSPKTSRPQIPEPQKDLQIIVAIPACDEPGILGTLRSLVSCSRPPGSVEVFVLLNAPETASHQVVLNNRKTAGNIQELSRKCNSKNFRLDCSHVSGIPEKVAGAGFARKQAMDHACKRFMNAGNPDGVILSLDADTQCEPGYLLAVYRHFRENPHSDACSIYFEHPIVGPEFPDRIYQGIVQYELHMRYYIQALRHAGHPHAYHTLGSCFAVRARVYKAQGGMNKRKAGEDFYFLHKIIPLGNFHEVCTTCLMPSPRPSSRVPFGTGPVMGKFKAGILNSLPSYHYGVFEDLKTFLDIVPSLNNAGKPETERFMNRLPASIRGFLLPGICERLEEIRANSASGASFIKRFYRWFGIFQVLKFINSAHRSTYDRMAVGKAAGTFLQRTGDDFSSEEPESLLIYLRKLQRVPWSGQSSASTMT